MRPSRVLIIVEDVRADAKFVTESKTIQPLATSRITVVPICAHQRQAGSAHLPWRSGRKAQIRPSAIEWISSAKAMTIRSSRHRPSS